MLEPAEAKRRFDWARRRGHPRWLWPDVTIAQWQDAVDRIEAALRRVLTGGAPAGLSGDPATLSVACYTSGTGPLLGLWAEAGRLDVPPLVRAMLALHLAHNRSRMACMTQRAAKLAHALKAGGIAATFLKGMHTAHRYFPEPGARPLSDIDLLIAPADAADAGRILAGLGYRHELEVPGPPPQSTWRMAGAPSLPRTLSFVHRDDPWAVDLQISLDRAYGLRPVRLGGLVCRGAISPWPVSDDADVLGQPLLLLHLAVHASCGLESMTLIRLVELAMVIRDDMRARSLSWKDFLNFALDADAAGMAYPALRLCEDLVPGTVPARVLDLCADRAPDAVKRFLAPLTPGRAHRVLRWSLRERFMWTAGWPGMLRLIVRDVLMPGATIADAIGVYRSRFWRLVHGTLTH